jgi:hypothetical protein
MRLMQLIYASQPFGFDDATLNGILDTARRVNPQRGITGALVCRADLYLQCLEGPRDAVTRLFSGIARDDRHLDIMLISATDIDSRLFGRWAMRDDPATSWMWSQAEVADGAVERASADDVRAIFARLATAKWNQEATPPG